MKKYILCAFLILLVGCAKAKPEDAVKGFMEAAKDDFSKAVEYINPANAKDGILSENSSDSQFVLNYLQSNAGKIEYKIIDRETCNNSAIVEVKCKYADCSGLVKGLMSEIIVQAFRRIGTEMTDEESEEITRDYINENKSLYENNYAEKVVKIKCTNIDGRWCVDKIESDLSDVLLSGFVSASEEINKQFSN